MSCEGAFVGVRGVKDEVLIKAFGRVAQSGKSLRGYHVCGQLLATSVNDLLLLGECWMKMRLKNVDALISTC
jgi:hypothetical protein